MKSTLFGLFINCIYAVPLTLQNVLDLQQLDQADFVERNVETKDFSFKDLFSRDLMQDSTPTDLMKDSTPTPITIYKRSNENVSHHEYHLLGMQHTLDKYTSFAQLQKRQMNRELDRFTRFPSEFPVMGSAEASGPLGAEINPMSTSGQGQMGVEKLINSNNLLFVAPVILGNGQKFTLDLDTGSSDTWFRGQECVSSDKSCMGRKADLKDPSLKVMQGKFITTYGSGEINGDIVMAPVSIGGQMTTLPVGISKKESGFDDGFTDGLLGLAFEPVSKISQTVKQNANFMDRLSQSKGMKNMVSFYMSNDQRHEGQVLFGGMDTTKFVEPITYMPLNSKSFWQFDWSTSTFSVGNVAKNVGLAGSLKDVISDTGTSLIILDTKVADALNQAIGAKPTGKGLYEFQNCDAAKSGPPVIFSMVGKDYIIPASIYVLEGMEGSKGLCTSGFTGGGKDQAILGLTFLRAYYSVYDKDGSRLGFARSIDNK